MFGSGFEQDSGAFARRGAGGEYVVDEEDACSCDVVRRPYGKCLAEILQTRCARKRDLRVGIDGTNQVSIGYRQAKRRTDAVGEEEGLVELPLPESIGMQRDRHQDIDM